jgi:hypothetical protein
MRKGVINCLIFDSETRALESDMLTAETRGGFLRRAEDLTTV